jgi:hypothetical protein
MVTYTVYGIQPVVATSTAGKNAYVTLYVKDEAGSPSLIHIDREQAETLYTQGTLEAKLLGTINLGLVSEDLAMYFRLNQ